MKIAENINEITISPIDLTQVSNYRKLNSLSIEILKLIIFSYFIFFIVKKTFVVFHAGAACTSVIFHCVGVGGYILITCHYMYKKFQSFIINNFSF